MARPKTKKENKRTKAITVRFTEDEFEEVDRFCREEHISKSLLFHDVYLGTVPKIPDKQPTEISEEDQEKIQKLTEETKKLCVEISRIGNNLNQIARHLNQGNEPTDEILSNINSCVLSLIDLSEKFDTAP